jgi:hypothetical protein
MQRHELDLVSLFAGVVFLAVAGGYALTHTTGVRLHGLVVVPAFLLIIGAAVTATALRRIAADRHHEDATSDVIDAT